MSSANATERIRSAFDISYSYCAILTNGVQGMDNRRSAAAGRGFGTASTNSMMLLENGQNDITVQIGALGWFDKHSSDGDDYKKFHPEAYCKLDLTLFEGKRFKSIGKIDIGINSDGYPYDKNNDKDIATARVMAPQVEKGHIPDKYFKENYFPKDMELYQFTKKITLRGLPDWKWAKSPPFTSTPEQIMALRKAYADLWTLFAKRNNAAIKEQLKDSTDAWSITTGDSADNVYNGERFVEHLKEPSFEMLPINWSDYQLVVLNKGRLVKFVNKSFHSASPISYYLTDNDGKKKLFFFSPIFSIVNGKITPVI